MDSLTETDLTGKDSLPHTATGAGRAGAATAGTKCRRPGSKPSTTQRRAHLLCPSRTLLGGRATPPAWPSAAVLFTQALEPSAYLLPLGRRVIEPGQVRGLRPGPRGSRVLLDHLPLVRLELAPYPCEPVVLEGLRSFSCGTAALLRIRRTCSRSSWGSGGSPARRRARVAFVWTASGSPARFILRGSQRRLTQCTSARRHVRSGDHPLRVQKRQDETALRLLF